MINRAILSITKAQLKQVGNLLDLLQKDHAEKPMTHRQAVLLEEIEQQLTDLKSQIEEIYETPELEKPKKPKAYKFPGTGFDPDPNTREP